jgi:hypothetical protein
VAVVDLVVQLEAAVVEILVVLVEEMGSEDEVEVS